MDTIQKQIASLGFQAIQIEEDNPILRKTKIPFSFPRHGCSHLQKLRRKFDFARVVHQQDEFADLVCLAKWVREHVHTTGRVPDVDDPIEILEVSAAKQAAFWCTHFALVYTASAAALGLTVRKISVDSFLQEGDGSTHHGTCEAYSTQFRKWFLIDPLHGMYYLKAGIPLNAYELDCEWQNSKGQHIQICDFNGNHIAQSGKQVVRSQHESSAYHFFFTSTNVDVFPQNGDYEVRRLLYYEDIERQNQVWYQCDAQHRRRHEGCQGDFLSTDRLDDFYFDLNLVHIQTRPIIKRVLAASFETFTPKFSHFLYRIDDGVWRRFSGRKPWNTKTTQYLAPGEIDSIVNTAELQRNEVAWKLHKGCNRLTAKPINKFGREGGLSYRDIQVI